MGQDQEKGVWGGELSAEASDRDGIIGQTTDQDAAVFGIKATGTRLWNLGDEGEKLSGRSVRGLKSYMRLMCFASRSGCRLGRRD